VIHSLVIILMITPLMDSVHSSMTRLTSWSYPFRTPRTTHHNITTSQREKQWKRKRKM